MGPAGSLGNRTQAQDAMVDPESHLESGDPESGVREMPASVFWGSHRLRSQPMGQNWISSIGTYIKSTLPRLIWATHNGLKNQNQPLKINPWIIGSSFSTCYNFGIQNIVHKENNISNVYYSIMGGPSAIFFE